MPTISVVERVRLNYSISTIASIVVYTFSISTFASYFSTLWPHLIFFVVAELLKFAIIQSYYSLDVTFICDGVRKRRSNKVSESIKFAVLMIFTVISFSFICIIMGGKNLTFVHKSKQLRTCFLLHTYSSRLRALRTNINFIHTTRWLDSFPYFNICGSIRNSCTSVDRIFCPYQPY